MEFEDSNQTGTIEDPFQEDSGDYSEDVRDPEDVSSGNDNGVSARPWTRSQGQPPGLVFSPPSLLQEPGGDTVHKPKGYTGRLIGWAASMWEELHHW